MIRGIWMWPNNIHAFSAEKIVSALSRARFTDIYFLTKGLSGKTSHHGAFAPHAFDRDVLSELLACAHAHGIRVHAWFTSASDEHYKSLHPESGRKHFKRGKDRGLISFKDEEYAGYLKRIINEVVQKYPVDGIHLDYIRYNHMLYGWDDNDICAYQAHGAEKTELFAFIEKTFYSNDSDKDVCIFEAYKNGNKSLKAFFEARKKDVNAFASSMILGLRALKPDLILSAAVMPEGAYTDHAFSDLHYGQVYSDLSPLFDYLVPMAYSKAYEKDHGWISEIGKNLIQQNRPFVMGIQAYDHAAGNITQSDLIASRAVSPLGHAVFREGECAIVYEDSGCYVFNDTPYPITRVKLIYNDLSEVEPLSIAPGETKQIHLSKMPEHILTYSDHLDVCTYYDKNNFI